VHRGYLFMSQSVAAQYKYKSQPAGTQVQK
jgi:hypothetical protein